MVAIGAEKRRGKIEHVALLDDQWRPQRFSHWRVFMTGKMLPGTIKECAAQCPISACSLDGLHLMGLLIEDVIVIRRQFGLSDQRLIQAQIAGNSRGRGNIAYRHTVESCSFIIII